MFVSPAFRYNLFVKVSTGHCHAEFIEASAINKQPFDKLRITAQKVFPLQSGLVNKCCVILG